jgi:uncharacterized membrane protein YfcA
MVLAYLVQTVSGFGALLVAVTTGAAFVPIETIVAIAIPLSLVQNLWIVMRHHDGIDRKLLFVTILPVMTLGMFGGFYASTQLTGSALSIVFGVLVLLLASRELWLGFRKKPDKPIARLGNAATTAAIFSAGVVHGVYGTGGPLLVYAVGRLELGKHTFRSTLTAVWLLLNTVLVSMFVYAGRITAETGTATACLLPSIPLGVLLGQWIHDRVDETLFRRLLFGLLAIMALPLIFR